jgi:hypothetical protein
MQTPEVSYSSSLLKQTLTLVTSTSTHTIHAHKCFASLTFTLHLPLSLPSSNYPSCSSAYSTTSFVHNILNRWKAIHMI